MEFKNVSKAHQSPSSNTEKSSVADELTLLLRVDWRQYRGRLARAYRDPVNPSGKCVHSNIHLSYNKRNACLIINLLASDDLF